MSDETLAATAEASAPAQVSAEIETKIETEAAPPPTETVAKEVSSEPGDNAAEDEASEKRKRSSGITRLKAQLAERETELERLRAENGIKKAIPGLGEPPKEADFNGDYFAYERAMTAHETAQKIFSAQMAMQEQSRTSERAALEAERIEAYEEAQSKARKALPDFDKVVAESAKSGVRLSTEFAQEIMSSDKAPLLQYHLSKPENWSLMRELNQMTGRDLARELGRLEGRLSWPRPKTETKAPAPLSDVKGGASSIHPSEMTYKQFVAFRESGGKITMGT
jgi:hypothetical protein